MSKLLKTEESRRQTRGSIEVLQRLSRLISALDLEPRELQRVERELLTVEKRLASRDYRIHSYCQNVHNVAERTHDVYSEVAFYCSLGNAWAELLSAAEVPADGRVLDLCPGFVPKVELGLFYQNFAGRVVLLNKDSAALQQLRDFLALFRPRFDVECFHVDIFDQTSIDELLNQQFHCVTANHIFDDLLLDDFCQREEIEPQRLYEEEGFIISVWRRLIRQGLLHFDSVLGKLARSIECHVAVGGSFIATQYPSYMERALGLQHASEFCRQFFEALVARLEMSGFEKSAGWEMPEAGEQARQTFGERGYLVLRRRW